MRKFIGFIALLLCAISVFATMGACQNSYDDDDLSKNIGVDESALEKIMNKYDESLYQYDGDAVTITMAHWDSSGQSIERAVVEAMLSGFKLRYPTINVNLDIVLSYEDTYGNRFAAGNVHDVFLVPDGAVAAWAPSKKMMNLTPYINASELVILDEMMPSSISRYQYNETTGLLGSGSNIALPKDIGPQVMYYNKKIFDEMGVDYPPSDRIMTIEEATVMWKKLVKRNNQNKITSYAIGGLGVEGLVWSAGGDFLNPARTAFPTDATSVNAIKKAYKFIQDAILTDEIIPPGEFTGGANEETLFASERVACLASGRWQVAPFRNLDFDWDIAYIPSFEENPTQNAWSGSVGYSVYTGSTKKEAAWKLVEYVASKEGQEILAATGFQIPVYEELALEEEFVETERALGPYNYEIFIESAKNQPYGLWQYRPSKQWRVEGYDNQSQYLYLSNSSQRWTVDKFVVEAEKKVNSLLGA